MGRMTVKMLGLSLVLCLFVSPSESAKMAKKGTPSVAYLASSLKDHLEYALHYDYCYPVKDAFDKRTCKKRFRAFSARMLKWVKRVWVVEENTEVHVKPYNFKRKAFVIRHDANIVTNSESDVRGRVVIGKGRCDKMTGLAEVMQTITIRTPVKKAAQHPLRQAAGEQHVKTLLRGSVGRVNWCCDAATRRHAKSIRENCKPRIFLYKMVGFVLDEDAGFRYRFPTNIVTRAFDPNVLGGYIPTGSGKFDKAK